jgi:hypothetical protein
LNSKPSRIAATLCAAALLVPAVSLAKPGHGHGKRDVAGQKGKRLAKGKAKRVTFVFKGALAAIDPGAGSATVAVEKGNRWARRYVQQAGSADVAFDLSQAELFVADVNASGAGDLADTAVGDQVIVQAKLAKNTEVAATGASLAARRLIDLSKPPVSDTETDD